MQFYRPFSLIIALSIFTQNVALAEIPATTLQDTQTSEQNIYHIALTPRESDSLGLTRSLEDALKEYDENQAKLQPYQTGAKVATYLVVGGAFVLTIKRPIYVERFRRNLDLQFSDGSSIVYFGDGGTYTGYSDLERITFGLKQLFRSEVNEDPMLLMNEEQRLRYAINLLNTNGPMYNIIHDDWMLRGLTLLGSTLAIEAVVGLPLAEGVSWLIEKFSAKQVDHDQIKEAFQQAQLHLTATCQAANGYPSKTIQGSMFQTMSFTDEDFDQGRVYLDGRALSKEEYYLHDSSKKGTHSPSFVFLPTEAKCRTGYFSDASLADLF